MCKLHYVCLLACLLACLLCPSLAFPAFVPGGATPHVAIDGSMQRSGERAGGRRIGFGFCLIIFQQLVDWRQHVRERVWSAFLEAGTVSYVCLGSKLCVSRNQRTVVEYCSAPGSRHVYTVGEVRSTALLNSRRSSRTPSQGASRARDPPLPVPL